MLSEVRLRARRCLFPFREEVGGRDIMSKTLKSKKTGLRKHQKLRKLLRYLWNQV